jgi:hypothetical protein
MTDPTTMVPLVRLAELVRQVTTTNSFLGAVFACLDAGESPKTIRRLINRTVEADTELALELHASTTKGQP